VAQAKTGDTVKVHYNGFLDDGTLFGSSRGHDPLELTIGEGKVIPGFENAVIDMEEGGQKTVTIPPEDAFGVYRENLVTTINKSKIPSDVELEVGKTLLFRGGEDPNVSATVKELTGNEVTLDANHPLAGKELVVDIELLEITT
jgi:peptidylprolyl isomerase